jgi:hypothetical protein
MATKVGAGFLHFVHTKVSISSPLDLSEMVQFHLVVVVEGEEEVTYAYSLSKCS